MARSHNIALDYSPRGPFSAFHQRKQRYAVLVCHRRAGKTVATIHDLIMKALATKKKRARYGYIAPLKVQCKSIAWDYIVAAVRPFGSLVKINNQELSVTFPNESSIRLYGADDPDSFRGLYFDGVVLDEFGDMKPTVFTENIRPTLSDRQGWVVFIGTPKGHNEFYKKREDARKDEEHFYYLELKASESGFLSDEELDDAKRSLTHSEYQQEYECSFEASLQGSFYAEQISVLESAGRITTVPWIKGIEVHSAWDLGFADGVAIWFWQLVAGEVRVIKYHRVTRQSIHEVVESIMDLPYEYGHFYLPHDASHTRLDTGKSIVEIMWGYGFDVRIVPKLSVSNGINAVRKVLNFCWFDLNNCYDGLEDLKLYQKQFSQQRGCYTDKPLHDEHSHGADSFRYLSVAIRDEHLGDATAPLPQVRKVETEQEQRKPEQIWLFPPPPSVNPSKRRIRV